MKSFVPRIIILVVVGVLFTSCEIIGDIFKVGMGVGIFLVVAVVALIIFVISKIGGSK